MSDNDMGTTHAGGSVRSEEMLVYAIAWTTLVISTVVLYLI